MPITPRTIFHMQHSQGYVSGPAQAGHPPTMATEPNDITPLRLVSWPWPAFPVACVEPGSTDKSGGPEAELLFLSPTSNGLDALEQSEQRISSIWLLVSGTEGPGSLCADRIEEISTWNARTPGGRQLSVLHGSNGRLIAIEDDDAFVLQSCSTDWTGSGPYKRTWASEFTDQDAKGR